LRGRLSRSPLWTFKKSTTHRLIKGDPEYNQLSAYTDEKGCTTHRLIKGEPIRHDNPRLISCLITKRCSGAEK